MQIRSDQLKFQMLMAGSNNQGRRGIKKYPLTGHYGLLQYYLLKKISLTLGLAHKNLMTTCRVRYFSQNPQKSGTKDEVFLNIYLINILCLSKDGELELSGGVTIPSPRTGCGTQQYGRIGKAEVGERVESAILGGLSQPQ